MHTYIYAIDLFEQRLEKKYKINELLFVQGLSSDFLNVIVEIHPVVIIIVS